VGASFQHSFKCNYIITFVGNHSYVSKDNPRWRFPSDATLLIKCCWNSLDLKLSLNNIAPSNDLNARSSVYTQQVFSLSLSDAKHNFDGLWRLIIWFFFAPSWSEYYLFSFLGSTVLPPDGQLFKECWEELMSFHVKDFIDSIDVLLRSTIFLVLESNLIFQRSCLFKSSCWNEIREMSILKSVFGNQACLVKVLTHAIQCSSLIVLYFENRNWPVVRLKWLFSWFFVSVLIFDLGYIFWWSAMRWPSMNFKKKKRLKSKLEDSSRKFVFF
jgi:hypothetical protein